MPRRYADYPASSGWELLNIVSTVGAFLIAVSVLVFLVAVVEALRRPAAAGGDPWEANSLEWWATSPPATHNFETLPPIRSERPVFDAREGARGGSDQPPASVAAEPAAGKPGAEP